MMVTPLAGLLFVRKLFLLTIYLLVIKLCNIHLIEPKSWVSFFLIEAIPISIT